MLDILIVFYKTLMDSVYICQLYRRDKLNIYTIRTYKWKISIWRQRQLTQTDLLWVKNIASTGIRTHDLPTWTIWYWVSAILTAFSHLSVRQGPRSGNYYHLGDQVVNGNQPELPLDYPDCVQPA